MRLVGPRRGGFGRNTWRRCRAHSCRTAPGPWGCRRRRRDLARASPAGGSVWLPGALPRRRDLAGLGLQPPAPPGCGCRGAPPPAPPARFGRARVTAAGPACGLVWLPGALPRRRRRRELAGPGLQPPAPPAGWCVVAGGAPPPARFGRAGVTAARPAGGLVWLPGALPRRRRRRDLAGPALQPPAPPGGLPGLPGALPVATVATTRRRIWRQSRGRVP